MKINSKKIEEIVKNSDNIVITAHKNLDLDALGSVLGFYYICSKLDKKATILIEDTTHEHGVLTALTTIQNLEYNIDISNLSNIKISKNTLFVIIDTNKKERIQNEKAFDRIANKIVIDHHIKENFKEEDFLYSYINTEESSSSEIISDILVELNVYIPKYIASIMLSGIMVDTNRFYLKTTKNTFDAASLLKKMGASTNDIQYLFKQDFNEYIHRGEIIKSTTFITENIVLAIADELKVFDNDELAKAADTISTFNYVEAAFVIGRISKDEIGISARSLGKIDVQSIMKELNGGGHKTEAATQIKGHNLYQAKEMLVNIITK